MLTYWTQISKEKKWVIIWQKDLSQKPCSQKEEKINSTYGNFSQKKTITSLESFPKTCNNKPKQEVPHKVKYVFAINFDIRISTIGLTKWIHVCMVK